MLTVRKNQKELLIYTSFTIVDLMILQQVLFDIW